MVGRGRWVYDGQKFLAKIITTVMITPTLMIVTIRRIRTIFTARLNRLQWKLRGISL